MKKYQNGQYVEMTEQEIESLCSQMSGVAIPPSLEDRMAALEAVQERLLSKLQAFLSI